MLKPLAHKAYGGSKFGRWTVIGSAPTRKHYRKMVKCKCACGTIGEVPVGKLGKSSKSCGCLKIKLQTKHGHAVRGTTSNIYSLWASMKDRCHNPRNNRYSDYGGRGIKVCSRWHDFVNFMEDMPPRPKGKSLDRINNNGNYEPKNCRWATKSEQQYNRRNPSVRIASLEKQILKLQALLKAKGVEIE